MEGSVCPQDPSLKSSLVLPVKKSVVFPGEVQENPVKAVLFHKQPPALPPKPFTRQLNHSIGEKDAPGRVTTAPLRFRYGKGFVSGMWHFAAV